MFIVVGLLACTGIIVSAYGYFVEQRIKQNPLYKPVCDISDKISCSKPMLSPFGSLLVLPNTIIGIAFYCIMLLFAVLEYSQPLLFCSVLAALASLYLGYILYFRIGSLCLLCSTIYLVNFGLLVASYYNL